MAIRVDDVDLDRDRALVQRFQAGDDGAFGELYRRYHDRLERFCLKRVGDQHAAEEVAQEAFTRALAALPALEGERRFYPWVSVIASRLCIDHHRRQARSEPTSDPDPGPVIGGQDEIVDAVDNTLAVAALARLAPRYQDVLQLREVEGWSYRRIAEHYDVGVGTIETLLFRARRALRREFHVVDGAGLAAIPLIGRLLGLADRIRNRIGRLPPIGGATSAVAAAAAATAAAVALAIVPGSVAVTSSPPPAASATAPSGPTGGPLRVLNAGSTLASSAGPPAAALGSDPGPSAALGTSVAATATNTRDQSAATAGSGTTASATDPTGPAPTLAPRVPSNKPAPLAGLTTTIAGIAPAVIVGPSLGVTIPGVIGTQPTLTISVPAVPAVTDAVGSPLNSVVGGASHVVGNFLGP